MRGQVWPGGRPGGVGVLSWDSPGLVLVTGGGLELIFSCRAKLNRTEVFTSSFLFTRESGPYIYIYLYVKIFPLNNIMV